MIRIILTYRRSSLVLLSIATLCGVGLLLSKNVMKIDLNPNGHPVSLPLVSACGVVGSAIVAMLLRPRFWEWEQAAGGRRTALLSAVAAFLGIATAPTIVVVSGLTFELHPSAIRYDITSVPELLTFGALNVTIIAALVFALSPLIGPLVSGFAGLLLWLGTAVLNNLVPGSRDYTPVTGLRLPMPTGWPEYPLLVAIALTALAVLLHARTRGSTEFAQRLWR